MPCLQHGEPQRDPPFTRTSAPGATHFAVKSIQSSNRRGAALWTGAVGLCTQRESPAMRTSASFGGGILDQQGGESSKTCLGHERMIR